MKHNYWKVGIISAIVIIVLLACFNIFSGFTAAKPAIQNLVVTNTNQQPILNDITKSLNNCGVPVKSIQIEYDSRWDPPYAVKCIIQSFSQNNKVASDDPIYLNLVGHEINLAKQHNLNVGAIHATLINTKGEILSDQIRATRNTEEIPQGFDKPSIINNDTIDSLLKNIPQKESLLIKLVYFRQAMVNITPHSTYKIPILQPLQMMLTIS